MGEENPNWLNVFTGKKRYEKDFNILLLKATN